MTLNDPHFISTIIPVLNEEKEIKSTLKSNNSLIVSEVLFVDGGSSDNTVNILREKEKKVILSEKGRARQMNVGAKEARGEVLVFLHADNYLQEGSLIAIENAIKNGFIGGCLRQRIDSPKFIYRMIESSGNLRAILFNIYYGDQAIFVRRDIFNDLGGFDEVDLLEDIMFSKKLHQKGKVCVLKKKVFTSARRWEKQGILKTTVINWIISLSFAFGVSPNRLRRLYYDIR